MHTCWINREDKKTNEEINVKPDLLCSRVLDCFRHFTKYAEHLEFYTLSRKQFKKFAACVITYAVGCGGFSEIPSRVDLFLVLFFQFLHFTNIQDLIIV